MTCPICEAHTQPGAEHCPRCGAAVAPRDFNAPLAAGVVLEGKVRPVPPSEAWALTPADRVTPDAHHEPARASMTTLVRAQPSPPMVSRRPSLPVLLWRQPAVRAVARAGAGALALSLGVRLLRSALARPRATGRVVSGALPFARTLLDPMLERGAMPRTPFGATNERGADVIETFLYVRQVVRRR